MNRRPVSLPVLLFVLGATSARSQVFEPSDQAGGGTGPGNGNNSNTTIINNSQPAQKPKSFLGNDVPFLDPGSEMASWDGHMWNVTNNRLFRARFEKYLAAPEESSARDQEYRKLLLDATKAMSPSRPGGPKIAISMSLLVKAAEYPIDARICDSIAQAVYGVVLHQRHEKRLLARNTQLEKDLRNLAWNAEVAGEAEQSRKKMESSPGKNGAPPTTITTEVSSFTRAAQDVKKMVEIDATRVTNSAKMTVSELKSKVEFQALIVQLFLQRRFEHVIIACRLYRNLYEDGDTELKVKEGSDVEKMFTRTTGTTPTVTALDAMSSEFIRDVDEGVQAFEWQADRGDLESASKRLSEAFVIGEYLPRLRTLPRTKKEKVMDFVRNANQLISALEVKDYTLAEELVERLRKDSKDFDYAKPRAAIETARAASALHIQGARSAAIRKDDKKVAEEIQQAALIWPTNPDLKAFANQVATYGDMHSRILNDLDTLIAQKNFREIFREQVKYSGAVLGKPDYEKKLKDVIAKVASVEKIVITADEMEKKGDTCGAWEQVEEIAKEFPDDNEVNTRRARLASRNPEFVNAVMEAKKHEESARTGVSLSWYLKAERLYPMSMLAKQGIERLADKILPERAAPVTPPAANGTPQ